MALRTRATAGDDRERFITWRRPGGRSAMPGETMYVDAKPVQTAGQLERPCAAVRGANRGGE